MGVDFLNENAIFYCAHPMSTFKFSCSAGQRKVYASGKPVLTENAQIDSISKTKMKTITCPILSASGTPQMCQCSLQQWINKGKAKADGKTVLIKTPSPANTCIYGAPIMIQKSGVSSKVQQGRGLVNISPIRWQQIYTDKTVSGSNISSANMDTPLANEMDVPKSDIKEPNSKYTNTESVNVIEQKNVQTEKTVQASSKTKKNLNLMCPYTVCEKCNSCAYPQTPLNVDNDSQKLRRAYEQMPQMDKDTYDRYYEQLYEKYGTTRWSYAAHHVISGNQVFKPHPEIVRLANFYGYDINCVQNCIMLVSKEDSYGNKVKSVSAYDAMSESGMQWHLGGHSYTFDIETMDLLYKQIEILTHKKPLYPLKNYMQLLSDELGKMEQSLMSRKVCRNTPQQKAAFIKRMNNLSKKVKNYLAAFKEKPSLSYPYYVSKEAYLYTFSLPYTSKVIFVKAAENNLIRLELFRVGRTQDEIKSKGYATFTLINEQDRIEFIKFCSNAEHFLFIDGDTVSASSLPFKPNISKTLPIIPLEPDGYMRHYASDILVWLRKTQTAYIAPLRKISERLKEVKST